MQTFALKSFSRLSRPFTDDDDDDHVDDVGVRAHMGVCVVEAANLLVAVSEGERERVVSTAELLCHTSGERER